MPGYRSHPTHAYLSKYERLWKFALVFQARAGWDTRFGLPTPEGTHGYSGHSIGSSAIGRVCGFARGGLAIGSAAIVFARVLQAGATSIAISLLNVPLYLKDRAVNVTAFNDGFAQARLWPT